MYSDVRTKALIVQLICHSIFYVKTDNSVGCPNNCKSCEDPPGYKCTSCKPGYDNVSNHCDTKCGLGTYGVDCADMCDCTQENGHYKAGCDHQHGTCHCLSGWRGTVCNDECKVNEYGEDCAMRCSCTGQETCDRFTGCIQATTERHDLVTVTLLPTTTVKNTSDVLPWPIIGTVVTLVLVIIITIVVCLVCKCRSGKNSRCCCLYKKCYISVRGASTIDDVSGTSTEYTYIDVQHMVFSDLPTEGHHQEPIPPTHVNNVTEVHVPYNQAPERQTHVNKDVTSGQTEHVVDGIYNVLHEQVQNRGKSENHYDHSSTACVLYDHLVSGGDNVCKMYTDHYDTAVLTTGKNSDNYHDLNISGTTCVDKGTDEYDHITLKHI